MRRDKHGETVSAVVGFIMEGHTMRDIIEWLTLERADDETSPSDTYEEACNVLLNAHRTAIGHNKAFVIEGLKEMYRRTVEIGDYVGGAKILVLIDKAIKPRR